MRVQMVLIYVQMLALMRVYVVPMLCCCFAIGRNYVGTTCSYFAAYPSFKKVLGTILLGGMRLAENQSGCAVVGDEERNVGRVDSTWSSWLELVGSPCTAPATRSGSLQLELVHGAGCE